MNQFTLTKNVIALLNNLKDSQKRIETNLCFAEGYNIFSECIKNKIRIKYLIIDENKKDKFNQFSNELEDVSIFYTSENTLTRLSTTKTSYSCITIFEKPDILKTITKNIANKDFINNAIYEIKEYIYSEKFIVALYNISDPGNLGTIIRTSIGFNQRKVIFLGNHCDLFSPKVIRSTSGAFFNLDSAYSIDEDMIENFLVELKKQKIKIIVTEKSKSQNYNFNISSYLDSIVIFGSEGKGVSENIRKLKDESLSIPQSDYIESYNLSISHGIISYILHQKKFIN